MSTVIEIEKAIERLSPEEMKALRAWLADREAAEWDDQFAADVSGGRLDSLADKAIRDFQGRRHAVVLDRPSHRL